MAITPLAITDDSGSGTNGTVFNAALIAALEANIDAALAALPSLPIDLTSDVDGVLPLADGGTGAALVDPGADRLLFWDDSEGTLAFLTLGTNLSITGTTLDAAGGGGGGDAAQIVFTPAQNNPPATIYATPDVRNSHPVLDFDAATSEEAIFPGVFWEDYDGEDVTATVVWAASTATSGNCKWNVMFERLAENDLDIDSDSFATAQTTTSAANATSGKLIHTVVTFTSSQIDGLVAGEAFRLKVARHASDAADTMTGDAELLRVVLRKVAA
jgi:hypothetical protein